MANRLARQSGSEAVQLISHGGDQREVRRWRCRSARRCLGECPREPCWFLDDADAIGPSECLGEVELMVVDGLVEALEPWHYERNVTCVDSAQDGSDARVADYMRRGTQVLEDLSKGHPGNRDGGIRRRRAWPVLDDEILRGHCLERIEEALELERWVTSDGCEDHIRLPTKRVRLRRAASGHWTNTASASG